MSRINMKCDINTGTHEIEPICLNRAPFYNLLKYIYDLRISPSFHADAGLTLNEIKQMYSIPSKDGIKFECDCGRDYNTICVYSGKLAMFFMKQDEYPCIRFDITLINPCGVIIGLTTGDQIFKKYNNNNNNNNNGGGELRYRNDIESNELIYAIDCTTGYLWSHRFKHKKWVNDFNWCNPNLKHTDDKLAMFCPGDKISIKLNLLHNHICIYKNNQFLGIAFKDITMNYKDCRLCVCMKSRLGHIVVDKVYPDESGTKKTAVELQIAIVN